MDKNTFNSTFLARWISGDITPDELKRFEKSKDFKLFEKINKVSQEFSTPNFDQELLFNKINNQISVNTNSSRVIKLVPNWAYAAAAAVVIAFGLFFINNMESHYQTGYSEQMAVILPDNSKVQLNANSELGFNKRNWEDSRELNLSGEAFFDVEKGKTFKVITSEGIVEVLGTEFNVISRGDYFEVLCKEGKVKVSNTTNNKEVILLPGKGLRILNNTLEEWNFDLGESNWVLGESTFYNTPLAQVLVALENQFEISFDVSNIDLNNRFTGGFSHKNLKLALKTVLSSMDISYTYDNAREIILVNSNN